jgi:hypothetical protein
VFCEEKVKINMKLSLFAKNVYSQFGEDGIIEKIFDIIGSKSKVCVEFGAWDGYCLSNTANLWTKGWTGILIEGDAERAHKLSKNVELYGCIAICRYVGNTKGNTLEDILKDNNINNNVDLLSIDIDGDDYYILASLNFLRPRVIICEYNHSIPYWMDIYQKPGEYFGSSVGALTRIAKEKGYELIAVTDTNCFFVQGLEYSKFSAYNTNINDIATNKYLNFVITSYSGQYLVYGEFPFGLREKYSVTSVYNHLNYTFNKHIKVFSTEHLESTFKSLYYGIIKFILRR